jgi:RNA polymerase sporulation-specific sigma factor
MSCKYQELTDENIIKTIHLGDDLAMEFLINKYKNLVRKKTNAYFLIGADKDDLIQEGMIGLFKAIREYDETRDAKFITFADLCVSRQIFTAVKASNRLKHLPLNSYISLNKPLYEEESPNTKVEDLLELRNVESPEDVIIGKENLRRIEKELENNLSELEKEVLFLYLEGQGYVQIAEIMGKQAKSIDNALQRIRKKVGVIFKEVN